MSDFLQNNNTSIHDDIPFGLNYVKSEGSGNNKFITIVLPILVVLIIAIILGIVIFNKTERLDTDSKYWREEYDKERDEKINMKEKYDSLIVNELNSNNKPPIIITDVYLDYGKKTIVSKGRNNPKITKFLRIEIEYIGFKEEDGIELEARVMGNYHTELNTNAKVNIQRSEDGEKYTLRFNDIETYRIYDNKVTVEIFYKRVCLKRKQITINDETMIDRGRNSLRF